MLGPAVHQQTSELLAGFDNLMAPGAWNETAKVGPLYTNLLEIRP